MRVTGGSRFAVPRDPRSALRFLAAPDSPVERDYACRTCQRDVLLFESANERVKVYLVHRHLPTAEPAPRLLLGAAEDGSVKVFIVARAMFHRPPRFP